MGTKRLSLGTNRLRTKDPWVRNDWYLFSKGKRKPCYDWLISSKKVIVIVIALLVHPIKMGLPIPITEGGVFLHSLGPLNSCGKKLEVSNPPQTKIWLYGPLCYYDDIYDHTSVTLCSISQRDSTMSRPLNKVKPSTNKDLAPTRG